MVDKNHVIGAVAAAALVAGLGFPGAASVALAEEAPAATAVTASADASVYTVSDNYPSLSKQLSTASEQGATELRFACDINEGGTVSMPAGLSRIQGWQNSSFFDPEGPRQRNLGYAQQLEVIFPSGSDVSVDRINFYKGRKSSFVGATAKVEKGATVRFSNCTFSNTPVVNGTAVFEDCTFLTGEVENNGTVTYSGSTKRPVETGKPAADAYAPLAMAVDRPSFGQVVVGDKVSEAVGVSLAGTAAETARVTVKLDQPSAGLTASYRDGSVVLEGTPSTAGTYQATVTAVAQKPDGSDDVVTKTLNVEVQERISVELRGSLQAFTSVTGKSERDHATPTSLSPLSVSSSQPFMVLASASAGGGGTTSNTATNKLELFVTEGKGEPVSILEFQRRHPDAKVTFDISPEGSGCNAQLVYDSVVLTGDPDKPGTYGVTATVTDGARSATSKPVPLRIYSNDKTLAERFAELPAGTRDWDMEPYEIAETGNAVVPKGLTHIWGSHESGVYGKIGSEKRDYASETLTIPAGADVTLSNMKVNSSVKIIVEKGAKLTLDDSVAFGPIEVYGTLSTGIDSATTSTITMHDGSTLEDAHIKSHAHYLTDGSVTAPRPESPVVIDGNVEVRGEVKVEGDEGAASLAGQPAIQVKSGKVTLAPGAVLEAKGGDANAIYPSAGGPGIVMSEGTSIVGPGTVKATGGQSYQNKAGAGIAGNGIVDVDAVEATGGRTAPDGYPTTSGRIGKGGDAVEPGVRVRAKEVKAQGGEGKNPGSSEVTPYEGESEPEPTPDPTPEPTPGATTEPGEGGAVTPGEGSTETGNENSAQPGQEGSVRPGDSNNGGAENASENERGSSGANAASGKPKTRAAAVPNTADASVATGAVGLLGGLGAALAGLGARLGRRRED